MGHSLPSLPLRFSKRESPGVTTAWAAEIAESQVEKESLVPLHTTTYEGKTLHKAFSLLDGTRIMPKPVLVCE